MSIPKIIHQFWTNPNIEYIPQDIRINMNSWEDTHPDFIKITWSLSNLSKLLKDFHGLNLLESINNCRFPAMQSDIVRLAVIYEYGGFWNDLKNYAIKPFINELIPYNQLILSEHWPIKTPVKQNPHLLNSFLGAPQNNEYIWQWIENAHNNIKEKKDFGVVRLTGAGVIMEIINQHEKLEKPCHYHLLKQQELWNILIKRKGGSYNDNNQHWSVRQKSESMYKK